MSEEKQFTEKDINSNARARMIISDLTEQLQTAKRQMDLDIHGIIKLQKRCLDLTQQNKQMRDDILKMRDLESLKLYQYMLKEGSR